MDTRAARRAAEKAARDLINDRAALVGEVAVMHTERTRLTADIDAAAARGEQLVLQAQAEAARLVAAAHERVDDATQRYADAYTAATAGGWTPTDLTALGFKPAAPSTTRRRRNHLSPADPAPAELALPAQPHDREPRAKAPDHSPAG